MSTNRLAIIQRIADGLGLRLSGTLTTAVAAGSTSLTDSVSRHEQDDYPNEGFLLATSSGGVVEEHRISDFSNATQTVSLYGSGLSTSLSSAIDYDLLLPPITPDQYRSAIKAAASKLAARGITRRGLDTSLVANLGHRYAVPSAIDVQLTEVYYQRAEFITNPLWIDGTTAWTLHASASLTNDGASGERTLKLVATAANEHSYCEVDVTPLDELEFFANVKSDGTRSARWQYRIADQDGTVIVAYTTIGSAVTAAAWTQVNGRIRVPANGTRIRIAFNTDAAGTVYTEGPQLMRYGDWERVAGWRPEFDGETGYLLLPYQVSQGRRLKVVGRRSLESLSADTDTLSMDEPEIAAFTELAMAESYRQFGGRLQLDQGTIRDEIATHEAEYRKIVGALSGPWKQRRHARLPRFSSGH